MLQRTKEQVLAGARKRAELQKQYPDITGVWHRDAKLGTICYSFPKQCKYHLSDGTFIFWYAVDGVQVTSNKMPVFYGHVKRTNFYRDEPKVYTLYTRLGER